MGARFDELARRYDAWPTLPAMFFDQAERLAAKPFLWAKSEGRYRALSWGEVATRVRALARGLRAAGLAPGDRVVLVSENRPEWLIADLAIMAAGCITVPAYTTNLPQDHLHIIDNSGARAVIVSTRALAARVLPAALDGSNCEMMIAMEPPEVKQHTGVRLLRWDAVMANGETGAGEVSRWVEGLRRTDTACVIYTSGTGGAPKGVMLSHGAILANCRGAFCLLAELGLENQVFLSFLPLSHSYEHTAGQFFPLSIGAQIYYAEGADSLLANMAEAHPTLMTAVPRLYETLHRRMIRAAARRSRLGRRLFRRTLELGRRAYEDPTDLSLGERLANRCLDRTVRRAVRANLGGRLKAFVSGGAPLADDIGLFFAALGVRLLQGYGQTEAAPVVSCNPASDNRIGTVGPAVAGVEVRIAKDGEILVRGEIVMQGYWNNRAASEATIRDGWLHTGDVGEMDTDGYIRITDRKKDIIVNSGGDNISPARIEGRLTLEPAIAQALVYGNRKAHLVAVVVPDEDYARAWADHHGIAPDFTALAADPAFREDLGHAVARVNDGLSPIERVRRFIVTAEPFAIENCQLTPTMKVRRQAVEAVYGAALEALYTGGGN